MHCASASAETFPRGRPLGGNERPVAQRRQVPGHEPQRLPVSLPTAAAIGLSAGDVGQGRGRAGPGHFDRAVAGPGKRIEHDDPAARHVDRLGQCGHALLDGRLDQLGGPVGVGPLLVESLQEETILAGGQLLLPLVAVAVAGVSAHVRAPGVLAEQQRVLVGLADDRCGRLRSARPTSPSSVSSDSSTAIRGRVAWANWVSIGIEPIP